MTSLQSVDILWQLGSFICSNIFTNNEIDRPHLQVWIGIQLTTSFSETYWKSFWHLINLRFIVCIIPPNTPSFLRWTWKCDRGRSPICPMQTSILMIKTCVILFLIFCVIHRHVSNLYVFCWVASNRDLSNQVQTWDNPL